MTKQKQDYRQNRVSSDSATVLFGHRRNI